MNGVWVSDEKDNLIYCNKYMLKIAGVNYEELIGNQVLEDFPESTLKYFRKFYNKAKKNLKPTYFHALPIVALDGRKTYQSGWLIPTVRNDKYAGMICTVEDSTERILTRKKLEDLNQTLEKKIDERTRELKKSEKRFRSLIEGLNEGVFRMSLPDGSFEYLSPKIEDVFGYEIKKFRKNPMFFREIIHPDFKKEFREELKKILNGKIPRTYEYKIIDSNNRERWIRQSNSAIFNEKGNIIQIEGLCRNITEEKKADLALIESEEKFRTLFSASPLGIGVSDLKGRVININKKMEEITGYSLEAYQKTNLASTYVDQEERKALVEELKQRGEVRDYIVRLKKKDGTPYVAKLNIDLIKIGDQKYNYTIVEDISKQMENELKLLETEEKYKTLFEKSIVPIFIVDDNGRYVDANEAALKFVKCEKSELVKKNVFDFSPPELKEKQKEEHSPFYTERFVETDYYVHGKIKTLLLNVVPFQFRGKKLLFGIGYEITKQKRAQEELIKLNRLKTDLLNRTSHELKTPLVSIKGFTELFLSQYESRLDKRAREFIEEVVKGANRLQELIKNILKTEQLKTDKIDLKKTDQNIKKIIHKVVLEMTGLIQLRKQSIKLNLQEDLYSRIDAEEISQVIRNLLSNSIKYTPPYGNIKIKAEELQNEIIFSIEDDGIGFTREEKDQIFKEFGKIERFGKGWDVGIEGTGLGLYTSKKIVELHGGKIWMESAGRNKGSIFYFLLPKTKEKF
ncbi:MAG: PAS domain S-box protein [Candidatus Lokiarchaeota archaeon]|nr:PAS domain S-box protein [Candidatus Lokiarchaeota archaeon]